MKRRPAIKQAAFVVLLFWCAFIACLVFCAQFASALPPANNEVTLQPTDKRDWSCDFGATVTSLISSTVTVRAGTDASPSDIINTPSVSGTSATFRIDGTAAVDGTVYQVTIVAADSGGQRFTCDGKVTIQTRRVVF